MKLVMRNTCPNEFLPGCDYTVVDIDGDLIDVIMARGAALRSLLAGDASLWQLRYWDWHPTCINAFDGLDAVVPPDAAAPFDEWIESAGGWVLVGKLAVPDDAVVGTDCQAMTITAGSAADGPEIEVGWAYYLKEGPDVIRTAGVNALALQARLAAQH